MEVGKVKIAEDSDFERLKTLIDDNTNWKLEYDKGDGTKVWTQSAPNSNFNMVKVHAILQNLSPETVYDVLHDPDYRKVWDEHMLTSVDIGYLNINNDVGYYALSCPTTVKNRDFVLQRSWLDLGQEKLIFNHSVEHRSYPPRKGFIRATSFITGYVVRPSKQDSFLGYVTHSDPRGKLPSWLVNKITQKLAPKVVKQVYKAALGYEEWKASQAKPMFKPWTYPGQMEDYAPRLKISECVTLNPGSTLSVTNADSDTD